MSDKDHSIEGNTDVPAGLDVVPAVPGTFIGGHDMQGADGEVRTDRPGELLGTPVQKSKGDSTAISQADYVRQEVDRANREELPLLGGKATDDWKAGDNEGSKAKTSELAPATARTAAVATTDAAPKPAPAKAADSGIKVKPGIDR